MCTAVSRRQNNCLVKVTAITPVLWKSLERTCLPCTVLTFRIVLFIYLYITVFEKKPILCANTVCVRVWQIIGWSTFSLCSPSGTVFLAVQLLGAWKHWLRWEFLRGCIDILYVRVCLFIYFFYNYFEKALVRKHLTCLSEKKICPPFCFKEQCL